MATEATQAVTIKGTSGEGNEVATQGLFHFVEYDQSDRMKRAVMAWVISWGLAIASLPLIIAHWLLVPGFLIAGPFMARRYYRTSTSAKKISGLCPVCGQECAIKLEGNDTLPMWTYCSPSRDPLHVIALEDEKEVKVGHGD